MQGPGLHPGVEALLAIGAGLCLLVGCNTARAPFSSHASAPGLSADRPMVGRGGASPNAPFMVVDHSARLVKRPALLDVNAALPCAATDLSLFESGARIDGDRRSVRLSLVNHAAVPCRLSGYPSVSLLRADGSLIGTIGIEKVTATTLEASLAPGAQAGGQGAVPETVSAEASQPSPMVLVVPAAEATFEVGWSSAENGKQCDQVASIAVMAPGTTQSFLVHHVLRVCEGRIRVTAVSDGAQL